MLASFLRSIMTSLVPDSGPQPHLYFCYRNDRSWHAYVLADADGVPIVFVDYGGESSDWVRKNIDKFEIPSDATMGEPPDVGGRALTADELSNPESVPWEHGWSPICLKKGEVVPERFHFNVSGAIADA